MLVSLIAYRALGYRQVKLAFNRPEHWRMVEALEKRAEGCETIDPKFLGWQLSKLDMRRDMATRWSYFACRGGGDPVRSRTVPVRECAGAD